MVIIGWMYSVCDYYVPSLVDIIANYFCNYFHALFARRVSQAVCQLG